MIETKVSFFKDWKGDKQTLAVFVFQNHKSDDALYALAKADGFKGKEGDVTVVRPPKGVPAERVILVGLGDHADLSGDVFRKAASRALKTAESLALKEAVLLLPVIEKSGLSFDAEVRAFAEGWFLGSYRFDRYKSQSNDKPKPIEKVNLLLDSGSGSDALAKAKASVTRARIHCRGTMVARDLINEPPSRMNPARLSDEAKKLHGGSISVTVHAVKDLEKMGMGAILAVGAGGAVPPCLVELIYKPAQKAKKTIALVGKGITFDSGGLSIKPAQSMETMKDDMSGAAAVIGVFTALSELKPPVEVRGYLAIAENMTGGHAQKPGDVLNTFHGKTIEVLNTDAEGRLVLADALAYACSKKPDVVIDIATLTGACVIALGHLIAAILSPDEALSKSLIEAGSQSGEKFWSLPLAKEYQADIKSKIADVKNIGSRRGEAGTIIGGLFLQEFVTGTSWAHLDIAGPSWTDSDGPLCPTGGTGHPVRTLLRWIENLKS